jgi:small subunit ribosomal protein S9
MIKETKPKTAPKAKKAVRSKKEVKEAEIKDEKKIEPAEPAKEKKVAIAEKAAVVELVAETPAELVETGDKLKKYYEAVGRRKTAIARVRLFTRGDKAFLVNDLPLEKYFPSQLKAVIEAPLIKMNIADRFRITALVKGGGTNAQAEAIRHGIARALVMFNLDFKKRLKKSGYLTRDPRMKERKKPGLRKARRAPQWAKR